MVAYATAQQLAAWYQANVGGDPPAGADRLLGTATRRVDDLLKTATYAVDSAGMPTDAAIITALADATCAQVQWMVEHGDLTGSGAAELYDSVAIGSVRLSRAKTASGGTMSTRYAPEAVSILQQHQLLPGTVNH